MLKRNTAAAFCFLCFITGCNSNPTENPPYIGEVPLRVYTQEPPLPFPDFIEGIHYIEFKQGRLQICLYISQEAIWELGDYAETLYEKIRLNSELKIDDEISPLDESGLRAGLLSPRYDDEGNEIGTLDLSPTDVCTTRQLEKGQHQGAVEIRMPSGKEYTYEWTFHH